MKFHRQLLHNLTLSFEYSPIIQQYATRPARLQATIRYLIFHDLTGNMRDGIRAKQMREKMTLLAAGK